MGGLLFILGTATKLTPSGHSATSYRQPASDPCSDFYQTVCAPQGETADFTGIVRPDIEGEKQALQIYKEIIRSHPGWSIEQVTKELIDSIYTQKRRQRVETAFLWVRNAVEKFISEQPSSIFSKQEKETLLARIRKVELQLPPNVLYTDEPDLYTKNDVFYARMNSGKLRLRVGGAYLLNAKSWFNVIFTMAHEFAHSIDPCEMEVAGLRLKSYQMLTSCFFESKALERHQRNLSCGEAEQISETFSDWLATEITSRALLSFSDEFHPRQIFSAAKNAVRDLCEQSDTEDEEDDLSDPHPSARIRITRIFGTHPHIRKLFGCPTTGNHFCQLKQGALTHDF